MPYRRGQDLEYLKLSKRAMKGDSTHAMKRVISKTESLSITIFNKNPIEQPAPSKVNYQGNCMK